MRLGKRVMGEIMVGKKDCEKRGRENKEKISTTTT